MKISTKQYQIMLLLTGVVILALISLQFGLGDIMKASFEGEKERPWQLYDITYTESLNNYNAVGNARFYNDRLIDSVICERFDFNYFQIDGVPYAVLKDHDVDIPYNDYYTMEFDLRNIPPDGIDVKLCAIGYDENGNAHVVPEELIIPLKPIVIEEPTSTATPTPAATQTPNKIPGFKAVFVIAGLLATMHLIKKE